MNNLLTNENNPLRSNEQTKNIYNEQPANKREQSIDK